MPDRAATPPLADPPMRRRPPCPCVLAVLVPWLPIPWPWALVPVHGLWHHLHVRCRLCRRLWDVEHDLLGVVTISRVA